MMRARSAMLPLGSVKARTRAVIASVAVSACQGGDAPRLPDCPAHVPGAPPAATGTFRYSSVLFGLEGTITFEQTPTVLSVLDTTYDHADDRALSGDGTWDGNIATVALAPRNGDTDYSASVTFSFSADGNEFCVVEFSDSNGDAGGEGTYVGVRE